MSNPTPTVALPNLARLASWLVLRATCGLVAQALLLSLAVAILTWGLATGILRSDQSLPWAVVVGLLTLALWLVHGRYRLQPLPLLVHAERHLRLHELWTTAWTLPTAVPASTSVPGIAAPPTSLAAAEFRQQVTLRAEAAAQSAQPADLIPLRLPTYWNLALVLALIGLGAGLRPQPEVGFIDADIALRSADPDDNAPQGGGPAGVPAKDATATPPPAHQPPVAALTPAQADLQQQWQDLVRRLDTPEKLQAALDRFAVLQQEKPLPADAIAAIEKRLREKEKALAAAGQRPGGDPPVAPLQPGVDTALPFEAISLLNDDPTIHSQIMQEIQAQYPEYEPVLTRYVRWLVQHQGPREKPTDANP